MPMSTVPPSPANTMMFVSFPVCSHAAAIPDAIAPADPNATLYTGMSKDVFGYTPCSTAVQHAGITRMVLGPAAFRAYLRMRGALHPGHAEVHFLRYSVVGMLDI